MGLRAANWHGLSGTFKGRLRFLNLAGASFHGSSPTPIGKRDQSNTQYCSHRGERWHRSESLGSVFFPAHSMFQGWGQRGTPLIGLRDCRRRKSSVKQQQRVPGLCEKKGALATVKFVGTVHDRWRTKPPKEQHAVQPAVPVLAHAAASQEAAKEKHSRVHLGG